MTGGAYLFGGLVYLFFASGDIEAWAKNPAQIEKEFMNPNTEKPEINHVFTLSDEEMIKHDIKKHDSGTLQTQF